ncbi:MAG TPA: hypothetical protein VM324_03865 [Egibacteraceae bacterium]|nr:hypothetical protein [Egibacteraceae bacterium]
MSGASRLRGEEGITLVELLVVTLLMAVIGGIVLTGVVSAHRVTRHTESRVQALTAIHHTMIGVGRHVRAADSRDAVNTALIAASPERLETDVLRGTRRIRYTYTLSAGRLIERRRVWDATASLTSTPTSDRSRTLMAGLVNGASQPLFSYRASDGSCVTGCTNSTGAYVGGPAPAAALAEIVEVGLRVRRDVGQGPPIEVVTRVVLRNA